MKRQNGYTTTELIIVIIYVVGFIGWVLNIVTIAGSDFNNLTGLLVLRIMGVVVAPLGAVLGFI